jgi:hypothetical protein
MWHSNLEKTFMSWHIIHQQRYTLLITLPVCRNPQHRRLLSQPLPHLHFDLFVISEIFALKAELLYMTNTSHHKQATFLYEHPLHWVLFPTKKCTTDHCSSVLHTQAWSPLNMRMCICYLDCHEAGLCRYLVSHTQNLLHPLQLFYFHLWPFYWLSLVY